MLGGASGLPRGIGCDRGKCAARPYLLKRFRPSSKRDIFFKKMFDSGSRVTYIPITGCAVAFRGGKAIWQSEANDRTSHLLRGGAERFWSFFWAGKFGINPPRGAEAPLGEKTLRVVSGRKLSRWLLLFDNCIGRKRDVGGVVLAGALAFWICVWR
jgi:hypothetical protein